MVKKYLYEIIFILLFLMVNVFISCSTTSSRPFHEYKPLEAKDYSILGTVSYEAKYHGVFGLSLFQTLGVSLPANIGLDFYLFNGGGASYNDFLNEARRKYPETDAIVDIKVDYRNSPGIFSIIYSQRKFILNGIAIRYERDILFQNITDEINENNKEEAFDSNIILNNNLNVSESISNNVEKLTVINVVGGVWRPLNSRTTTRVNINDVLTLDTNINIASSSLITLSDGSKNYTIRGQKNGKIRELIN